jgi:hypothetical protein
MDNEVITAEKPVIEETQTKDLKEVIKVPTEYKAPTGLNIKHIELKDSDFVDAPLVPDETGKKPDLPGFTQQNLIPGTNTPQTNIQTPLLQKPEKIFDPDFTTDICVDMFDTAQHTTFLALNNRKQKKKRFKNDDEYYEAIKLSTLTITEIEKQESPDDKKLLLEKLNTFKTAMKKINQDLSLTIDEKKRLKKPIYELVKQHNFDIPPGLALVLVSLDIISNRVVDLIMD